MIARQKSSKFSEVNKEFFQEKYSGVFAIKILKITGVILLICIVAPLVGIFNALKYILKKVLKVLNDILKHVYKLLIVITSVIVVLFVAAFIASKSGCPWLSDLVIKIIFK